MFQKSGLKMEHETRRERRPRRKEISAAEWPTNGVSMFGIPSQHRPPPPPPPRPRSFRPADQYMIGGGQVTPANPMGGLSGNLCALAEAPTNNTSSNKRIQQFSHVVSQQVQAKSIQAGKNVKKVAKKSWKRGKEGFEEIRKEVVETAIPAVKSTLRQLSSPSSNSFDSSASERANVEIVTACPASFHPAFMHGDKFSAVPGIHPPSYEDALRDPTEPPTYAQPPPTPPINPPPSTGESSGTYGQVERVNYPDFDQVYDFGGFQAPSQQEIYDNHMIDENHFYDQAGPITGTTQISINNPPELPPRNKKLPVKTVEPEVISIDESVAEHELVRVTSQLTTVTQLSDSPSSSSGSKLKRIISDPVQLTNPFTMGSIDPFQETGKPKPLPKARTRKMPTPPPRRSLMIEPEPVCVRIKTPPLKCQATKGQKCENVEIIEQDRIDAIKESIYQLEADLDSDNEFLEEQQRRMKLQTRHSLRQMKNEFMKKVRFPYLAKVLGPPNVLTHGQLKFKRGDHVVVSDFVGVSQQDGQKWFFGEHTETGEKGIFPDDLVSRVIEDEPIDSTIWV